MKKKRRQKYIDARNFVESRKTWEPTEKELQEAERWAVRFIARRKAAGKRPRRVPLAATPRRKAG